MKSYPNTALWVRLAEALQVAHMTLYRQGWDHGLTAREFRRLHRLKNLGSAAHARVTRDPQWRAIRRALAL